MRMSVEWRGPVPSSNYDVGRGGERVSFIVEHWTDARLDSAIARFMDPRTRVSAHYIVAQDGRVLQLVSEDDTAFHAGEYGANQLWLARALLTGIPSSDLSGPDVETGQAFDPKTIARR